MKRHLEANQLFEPWMTWGKHYPADKPWPGPCGDSFCYSSCDLPSCRRDYRLGDTPREHNEAYDELHCRRANHIIELYDVKDQQLKDDIMDLFRRLKESQE